MFVDLSDGGAFLHADTVRNVHGPIGGGPGADAPAPQTYPGYPPRTFSASAVM